MSISRRNLAISSALPFVTSFVSIITVCFKQYTGYPPHAVFDAAWFREGIVSLLQTKAGQARICAGDLAGGHPHIRGWSRQGVTRFSGWRYPRSSGRYEQSVTGALFAWKNQLTSYFYMLNQNFPFAIAFSVYSTDVLFLFQRIYHALYASDWLSCLFCKFSLLNRRVLFY